MGEFADGSNKRKIIEKAAEVEKEQRPYDYEVSGVEYADLTEYFEVEDFGVHPTIRLPLLLKNLAEEGYLRQVYPSGSSANAAYRLSETGWNIVDLTPPEE
jgi:hypothetical protein